MPTLSSRALGASEAYYQLVDRLWPANAHCAVDIAADVESVRSAWAATVHRIPVLNAALRIVDGRAEVVFGGPEVPEIWKTFATIEDAMAAQAMEPLDSSRTVARCALVAGDGTTTAVIAGHHSLFDGRGLAQVSLVLAALAAGEEPPPQPIFAPTVSVDAVVAAQTDVRVRRRELLLLARDMRAESGYLDNADRLPWHNPTLDKPRDIASALFRLDPEHTTGLLTHARSIGATVYGLIAAAVLRSCAELAPDVSRLALSTPVDLRAANRIPDDVPVGQAAALIAGS